MIITVTGHRPKYLGNEYNLVGPYSDYIRKELQKIIDERQPIQMISGMALGVDTMWALLAIKNKIPLIAALNKKKRASGTAYTAGYAKKNRVNIIYVDPEFWRP